MPRPIGVIQKPGLFEDLLRRTGVNRPQQPFVLDGDVVPVILVDSAVSFVASPTPPYTVPDIFTAGIQVAPADNFVLADTGPLPIGPYTIKFFFMTQEALGSFWTFEWRDSANALNLWVMRYLISSPGFQQVDFSLNVSNANERFRILNIGVGGAGVNYQASILARI